MTNHLCSFIYGLVAGCMVLLIGCCRSGSNCWPWRHKRERTSVQDPGRIKNKKNSTAGAVRVDANLPGQSTVITQFVLEMHSKKMFYLEHEGQSDWSQHPKLRHLMANKKSIKDMIRFCVSFTISEIFAFHIFYLGNLGQGHRVQYSQWCHSMGISSFIKVIARTFTLVLSVFSSGVAEVRGARGKWVLFGSPWVTAQRGGPVVSTPGKKI